jgi:hypothetical protein
MSNNDNLDHNFDQFIKFNVQQKESQMRDPLWEENASTSRNFTNKEVYDIVMNCKNGKSPGIDEIPYEVLKNNECIEVLTNLFQLCFDAGKIPSVWRKSIISPIEKSKDNDPRIPLNYRGISLVCCISKIYSSVINKRVVEFLDELDVVADEQNGFRKDRSCRDHIFVIDSIIRNKTDNGGSVFAAFIDFKKAFDCINREYLRHKILENGIT